MCDIKIELYGEVDDLSPFWINQFEANDLKNHKTLYKLHIVQLFAGLLGYLEYDMSTVMLKHVEY